MDTERRECLKIKDREFFRDKWGWFFALGSGLVLLGVGAVGAPMAASFAMSFFIGSILLINGIIQGVHAFSFRKWGDFFGEVLLGVIAILVGLYVLFNPLLSMAALTIILALYLFVEGITKCYAAFKWRPLTGWVWTLLSGVLSIVVGILIAIGWPTSSLFTIALFLGINFVFMGFAFLMLGLNLRQLD